MWYIAGTLYGEWAGGVVAAAGSAVAAAAVSAKVPSSSFMNSGPSAAIFSSKTF